MLDLDYEKIGYRIKSSREKAAYSQEALAEIVNCSTKHISSVENGKKKPSHVLRKMEQY